MLKRELPLALPPKREPPVAGAAFPKRLPPVAKLGPPKRLVPENTEPLPAVEAVGGWNLKPNSEPEPELEVFPKSDDVPAVP